MFAKILKKMDYHKDGFESLKTIQSLEKGIIPLSIMQSFMSALFPYMELFITAYMIDAMIARDFNAIPFWIMALILSNFGMGLLIDLIDKVNQYKTNHVHRKMMLLINKKTMELDYDIMEDAAVLQKISDAEYAMEKQGGYYAFVSYYRELLESIIKILTSVSLIVFLCFIAPTSGSSLIKLLASTPFSLTVLVILTVLSMIFNQVIAIRSCGYSSELFEKKKTVERRFDYYTDRVFLNYPMGKDIRLFNMFELIHNHYDQHMREASKFFDLFYYEKSKNKESGNLLSNAIYMYMAYVIVILKVLAGSITIGELTKYIGAISIFNTAIVSIISTSQRIKLQTNYVKVFNELLNMASKKQTGSLEIEKRADYAYDIEFHNVSFKYPNEEAYTLALH